MVITYHHKISSYTKFQNSDFYVYRVIPLYKNVPYLQAEVFGGGGEGGDSDSEDESGRNKRDRFKTERQTITLKSSTFSTNTVPDIPDNLGKVQITQPCPKSM